MQTDEKYHILETYLKACKRVAVAFSGGVDSTFLLKAAADVLGAEHVLACIGISASLSQFQLQQARSMASLIGVELAEIPLDELNDPKYQANKADRCFHCKSCQFRTIQEYARRQGFDQILCGSNFDDRQDFRPGNRAVRALGIGTPLLDAELTKAEIRRLSRELGLPTADVPASPCLASRIAYGQTITADKLKQVEAGEDFLRELGFVEFRVRHHGDLVRLEVPPESIESVAGSLLRSQITQYFKSLGFHFVSLDLQGFRSGAMNESLEESDKQIG